jgi:2-iminobutanoate/2-iminopropanoate deaminase
VFIFEGHEDTKPLPHMNREIIKSPDAPAAIGPYSQAVRAGDTVYCSGQIPIDPKTGELVTGSIEDQTTQVLDNLGAVLGAAGLTMQSVVRCTVFVSDMGDFGRVNEVYARYFSTNPPARATVEVSGLPKDVDVEISCIAVG